MKRLFPVFILSLISLMSFAQPRPAPPERMNDDEIIEMQTKRLVSILHLDKTTEDRFVKEYSAFRKEIDAVAKHAMPPQKLEDESEIDKAIQRNFAVSEQILQIRIRYYSRFKDFMKPSQIQMMYHLENEAGRRMHGGPGEPGGPRPHEDRPMPPHEGGEMPPMGQP